MIVAETMTTSARIVQRAMIVADMMRQFDAVDPGIKQATFDDGKVWTCSYRTKEGWGVVPSGCSVFYEKDSGYSGRNVLFRR